MLLPLLERRWIALIGVLILVGGILPNLSLLTLGWLVARIQTAIASGSTDGLAAPLITVLVLFVAANAHAAFSHAYASTLGLRFDSALRHEAMRAAMGPAGISHLEDPRIADRLIHVEELTYGWLTSSSVRGLISAWTGRVRGIVAGGILATFAWWAPLVVFVGYRAHRAYSTKTGMLFLRRYESNAQGLRRARYLQELISSGEAAKESRIFGFSSWAIGRFRRFWDDGMREVWRERVQHELFLVPVVVALGTALGLVAGRIGLDAISGALPGDATGADAVPRVLVWLQAMFAMQGFTNQGDGEWQMHFGAYRAREARRLAEVVRTPEADLRGDADAPMLDDAIRLVDVSFTYPGTDAPVLDHLDLTIPAGGSLAIVGANGAGKTTLIKLLCRLYDPTLGRITIDGTDLSRVAPEAWRRRVGVIFQDYVRYPLPLTENVGYGAIDRLGDAASVERALALSGADSFADRLGTAQTLSRAFEDGAELSGGEWQRVALARALMAIEGGATLLILDEPTANLDVRAEAAIYERFLEMTRGITTILISHRFSTVRLADLIAVVEGGRVVELGSHDELLARNGRYAEMFTSQARAYVERVAFDDAWQEASDAEDVDA
jgi:ATP-binding cassette subfamily B protein